MPATQRLSEDQVTRAVKALAAAAVAKQAEEEKAGGVRSLFEEDEPIFMMFAMNKTPTESRTKPFQIPLAHTLYGQDGQEVCLITKDPVKPFKEYVEENPIPGLTKVIGFTQLKRNYNQYKTKRELLVSYDLFLADDRILPLLPPVLGKSFFERKKQPYPVVIKGRNWTPQITRARDSTYFFLSTGPSTSVRVSRMSFPLEHTVENVMGVVEHVVSHIPRKWNNVQAIYLKSATSVALPIYTSLPEHSRPDTTSDSMKSAKKSAVSKKRGPTRPADDEVEEEEAVPKATKKRKTVSGAKTSKNKNTKKQSTGQKKKKAASKKRSVKKGKSKSS